jgi:hypothetical protein
LSGPLNVLTFNEAVQPINLALTGTADPEPGLSVTVAGWGTTSVMITTIYHVSMFRCFIVIAYFFNSVFDWMIKG